MVVYLTLIPKGFTGMMVKLQNLGDLSNCGQIATVMVLGH
jgi:hypothetical protein